MAKMTRRRKTIEEKVDYERTYAISEAVTLLNEISGPKFSESLDISVNLGIDPQKSDQTVRGATSLPHGSGKRLEWRYSRKRIARTKPRKQVPISWVLKTWRRR